MMPPIIARINACVFVFFNPLCASKNEIMVMIKSKAFPIINTFWSAFQRCSIVLPAIKKAFKIRKSKTTGIKGFLFLICRFFWKFLLSAYKLLKKAQQVVVPKPIQESSYQPICLLYIPQIQQGPGIRTVAPLSLHIASGPT